MSLIVFTDIEGAKITTTANSVTLINTPEFEGKSENVVVVNGAGFKVADEEFSRVRRMMEIPNNPTVLAQPISEQKLSEL